jgi:DNA modification methylase
MTREEVNGCTVLLGDCLQFTGEASIIITDLPYGTTNCDWDSAIDLAAFWRMSAAATGGKVISFAQTPFDKVLGASNLKNLKYELIWEKSSATGHLNAKKMPMKAHENILVFGKVPYFPQMTHGHVRKTAKKRNGDKCEVYGDQNFAEIAYDSTSRYPRSVLKFPSDKQKSRLHPTQKPLALVEWLIKTYTKEGDTVLDPCMGSGTTGLACLNLNRKFIGIEIKPNFYEIAKERLRVTA